MDHEQKLLAFFEAENRRNWKAYRTFLHPDVRWTLYGEGKEAREIVGVQAYMSAMMAAYEGSKAAFVCESLLKSSSGSRVVTVLKNSLGARSCDIFEFQDGLILLEHEFLLG